MPIHFPQNSIETLGIPILAAILSGVMQHIALPKLYNSIIACVFFGLAVAGCYYFGGNIVPDFTVNVLLYMGIVFVIIEGTPASYLRDALVETVPSPVLLFVKREVESIQVLPAPGRVSAPEPIILTQSQPEITSGTIYTPSWPLPMPPQPPLS